MKTIILVVAMSLCSFAFGQTQQGKILAGGSGSLNTFGKRIGFELGVETSYFIIDNLALKGEYVYGKYEDYKNHSFRVGIEYYISGYIPIALLYGHLSSNGYGNTFNTQIVYLQIGRAFFVKESFMIKPYVRFDMPTAKVEYESQGIIGGISLAYSF